MSRSAGRTDESLVTSKEDTTESVPLRQPIPRLNSDIVPTGIAHFSQREILDVDSSTRSGTPASISDDTAGTPQLVEEHSSLEQSGASDETAAESQDTVGIPAPISKRQPSWDPYQATPIAEEEGFHYGDTHKSLSVPGTDDASAPRVSDVSKSDRSDAFFDASEQPSSGEEWVMVPKEAAASEAATIRGSRHSEEQHVSPIEPSVEEEAAIIPSQEEPVAHSTDESVFRDDDGTGSNDEYVQQQKYGAPIQQQKDGQGPNFVGLPPIRRASTFAMPFGSKKQKERFPIDDDEDFASENPAAHARLPGVGMTSAAAMTGAGLLGADIANHRNNGASIQRQPSPNYSDEMMRSAIDDTTPPYKRFSQSAASPRASPTLTSYPNEKNEDIKFQAQQAGPSNGTCQMEGPLPVHARHPSADTYRVRSGSGSSLQNNPDHGRSPSVVSQLSTNGAPPQAVGQYRPTTGLNQFGRPLSQKFPEQPPSSAQRYPELFRQDQGLPRPPVKDDNLPAEYYQSPVSRDEALLPRQQTAEYSLAGVGPDERQSRRNSGFFKDIGGRISRATSRDRSGSVNRENRDLPKHQDRDIEDESGSIASEDMTEKKKRRRSSLFGSLARSSTGNGGASTSLVQPVSEQPPKNNTNMAAATPQGYRFQHAQTQPMQSSPLAPGAERKKSFFGLGSSGSKTQLESSSQSPAPQNQTPIPGKLKKSATNSSITDGIAKDGSKKKRFSGLKEAFGSGSRREKQHQYESGSDPRISHGGRGQEVRSSNQGIPHGPQPLVQGGRGQGDMVGSHGPQGQSSGQRQGSLSVIPMQAARLQGPLPMSPGETQQQSSQNQARPSMQQDRGQSSPFRSPPSQPQQNSFQEAAPSNQPLESTLAQESQQSPPPHARKGQHMPMNRQERTQQRPQMQQPALGSDISMSGGRGEPDQQLRPPMVAQESSWDGTPPPRSPHRLSMGGSQKSVEDVIAPQVMRQSAPVQSLNVPATHQPRRSLEEQYTPPHGPPPGWRGEQHSSTPVQQAERPGQTRYPFDGAFHVAARPQSEATLAAAATSGIAKREIHDRTATHRTTSGIGVPQSQTHFHEQRPMQQPQLAGSPPANINQRQVGNNTFTGSHGQGQGIHQTQSPAGRPQDPPQSRQYSQGYFHDATRFGTQNNFQGSSGSHHGQTQITNGQGGQNGTVQTWQNQSMAGPPGQGPQQQRAGPTPYISGHSPALVQHKAGLTKPQPTKKEEKSRRSSSGLFSGLLGKRASKQQPGPTSLTQSIPPQVQQQSQYQQMPPQASRAQYDQQTHGPQQRYGQQGPLIQQQYVQEQRHAQVSMSNGNLQEHPMMRSLEAGNQPIDISCAPDRQERGRQLSQEPMYEPTIIPGAYGMVKGDQSYSSAPQETNTKALPTQPAQTRTEHTQRASPYNQRDEQLQPPPSLSPSIDQGFSHDHRVARPLSREDLVARSPARKQFDQQPPYKLSLPGETPHVSMLERRGSFEDGPSVEQHAARASNARPQEQVLRQMDSQPPALNTAADMSSRHSMEPESYPLPDSTFSPINPRASRIPAPPLPLDATNVAAVHQPPQSGLDRSNTINTVNTDISQLSHSSVPHPASKHLNTNRAVSAQSAGWPDEHSAQTQSHELSRARDTVSSPSQPISPQVHQHDEAIATAPDNKSGASFLQRDEDIYDVTPPLPKSQPYDPNGILAPDTNAKQTSSHAPLLAVGAAGGLEAEAAGSSLNDHSGVEAVQHAPEEKIWVGASNMYGHNGGFIAEMDADPTPMMSATSYPGMEWNPYGEGAWDDGLD